MSELSVTKGPFFLQTENIRRKIRRNTFQRRLFSTADLITFAKNIWVLFDF